MSGISKSKNKFFSGLFRFKKTGAPSILVDFILTALTASRSITLPDKSGTLAMTSDVSAAADMSDSDFRVHDNGDATKKVALEVSNIDTATTRTLTTPNRNLQLGSITAWATATKYIIGDVIVVSYLGSLRTYKANTAHTAGATFAGDVANWDFIGAVNFESALFALLQTADPTKKLTFDLSLLSATRSVTLPDKAGTMAMLSDISGAVLADTQFLYRQGIRNSNIDFMNGTFTAPATDIEIAAEIFAIKTAGGGTAPSITFTQDNSTLPDKKSSFVLKANVTATGSANATTEGGFYFYIRDFEKYQGRSISFSIYMKAPVASELIDIAVYDGVQTNLVSRKTLTTGWVLYTYENISINSAATQIKITVRLAGGTGLTVPSSSSFTPANTGAFYFAQLQLNDGTAVIAYQPPINKSGKGSYIRRRNGLTRGAVNTNVIIYGTAIEAFGSDITYVNSANNGDGFLCNSSGIYSVNVSIENTTSSANIEIRVGASIDNNQGDASSRQSSADIAALGYASISWTGYVPAGNYIWFSTTVAPTGSVYRNQISIAKVANFD